MARKNQPPPKSFEDALAELEQILADIEGGQVPLEQSLTMYERGQFLVGHCRSVLARAEKQIEVLGRSESGELTSRPMAVDGANEGQDSDDEAVEDDEFGNES
jgi:exodeoxyribonuclease VII small subunit